MNQPTVTIAGARGGQGTTTVATALAIFGAGHQAVRLVSTDAPAVLGLPEPAGAWEPVDVVPNLTLAPPSQGAGSSVLDAGRLCAHDHLPGPVYVVLRGPCYLGLRELVLGAWPPPDGVILVMEDGRSLTDRDVADVLVVPVVARIRHSARVARTIDAGLLLARLHRHSEFKELSEFARLLFAVDGQDWKAA
ncbi:MAG: hypothetical protein ACRDZ3_07520 [Acidimicrobiia bacterium]